MLSNFVSLDRLTIVATDLFHSAPFWLLAKGRAAKEAAAASYNGPTYSLSWGIVIFLVAAGLIVTLTPIRRTTEVKRPKIE